MLRRRPDDTFELFLIGVALQSAAPPPLSDVRREALRGRIMSSLGAQDRKQPAFGFLPGERWVLIPAGIGVAAAILAAAKLSGEFASASGQSAERQVEGSAARDSQSFVATADSWRTFYGDVAVGLERGSEIAEGIDPDARVLRFMSGRATVAVHGSPLDVVGPGFSAELRDGSIAIFESRESDTLVQVMLGSLTLTFLDGSRMTLLKGAEQTVPFASTREDEPVVPATTHQSESPPGAPDTSQHQATVAPIPETSVPGPAPFGIVAGGAPEKPQPSDAQVAGPSTPISPPISGTFDDDGTPTLELTNLELSSPEPSYSPDTDGSSAGSDGNGSGNPAANSNGNGTASSNAGGTGNGNGAASSNAGGNGNGNGAANSNAGGIGNSNGATNSNAGGNENGNGAANSNAGGNGNGNGAANSNAGGNGNGNGAANSNAGGNGNGNGAVKKS